MERILKQGDTVVQM